MMSQGEAVVKSGAENLTETTKKKRDQEIVKGNGKGMVIGTSIGKKIGITETHNFIGFE